MTLPIAENLDRLQKWCRAQDPNATIWLHIPEAKDAIEKLVRAVRDLAPAARDRSYDDLLARIGGEQS